MEMLQSGMWLTVLGGLSWVCCGLVLQSASPRLKLLLTVYWGSYSVTSLVGLIIIGIGGLDILDELAYGLDLKIVHSIGSFRYWLVVFSPLLIPALTLAVFAERRQQAPVEPRSAALRLCPVRTVAVFGAFAALAMYHLYQNGFGTSLLMWNSLKGEFSSLMVMRKDIMDSLGNSFFGVVYTTLPCLSHAALYCAVRLKTFVWRSAFAVMAATTVLLSLSTIQKSLVLVYFISLMLSLIQLGVIRTRRFVLFGASGVAVLTLMQSFYVQDWNWSSSVELICFRMAVAIPYFLDVYPDILPHFGIDLGLHPLGIGVSPRDTFDVFAYMYPSVKAIEGNAAAPAHIRAFAQAGLAWMVVTLIGIGLGFRALATALNRSTGPVSHAFYVQCLMVAYYLTQTSTVETVVSSYGLCWAIVALIPLQILGQSSVPETHGAHPALPQSGIRRDSRHPSEFRRGSVPAFRPATADGRNFAGAESAGTAAPHRGVSTR